MGIGCPQLSHAPYILVSMAPQGAVDLLDGGHGLGRQREVALAVDGHRPAFAGLLVELHVARLPLEGERLGLGPQVGGLVLVDLTLLEQELALLLEELRLRRVGAAGGLGRLGLGAAALAGAGAALAGAGDEACDRRDRPRLLDRRGLLDRGRTFLAGAAFLPGATFLAGAFLAVLLGRGRLLLGHRASSWPAQVFWAGRPSSSPRPSSWPGRPSSAEVDFLSSPSWLATS